MRLFISLDLPEDVFHFLRDVQTLMPRENVALAQYFHMTLFYLGDVDEGELSKIKTVLSEIKSRPIGLNMNGEFGVFEPIKNELGIVWVGVEKNETLLALRKSIVMKMIELGFDSEFEFVPHITVAKVRGEKDAIEDSFEGIFFKKRSFEVRSFSLMQSELLKDEAFYTPLESYALK